MNTEKVTRIEVVDWAHASDFARLYTRYDVSVELSLQDEGRTLKVFLRENDDAR